MKINNKPKWSLTSPSLKASEVFAPITKTLMPTYKSVITPANIKKYDIPKDWSITQFSFINPTASPFTFNLFKQNNVANYPTTPTEFLYPTTLNNVANIGNTNAISWNSISNKIYIHNSTTATVDVINPVTLLIETSIPTVGIGDSPAMAFSPVDNRMFLLAPALNQYWVIDCVLNTVINTIALGGSGRDIVYNSIKNSFYAITQTDLIEIRSDTQLIVFSTGLGANLTRLTFVSSKNDVYVTDLANIVIDFDCTTNTTVGLPIGVSNSPNAIEYCSVKDTVYVAANVGGFIEEVDVVTNTLLATNIPESNVDLIYVPYANVLYGNDGVTFYTIDCATNTIITAYPPLLSGGAFVFALDTTDNRVFCSGVGAGRYYLFTPTLRFYITGSDNYNEWVQGTFNDPMVVRRVQYISQNSNNFNQVLNKTHKDANGNEIFIPLIPDLSVSINMYQSGMAQMEFFEGHLTLGKGGDYFSSFTVDALSEIKMLIYFKQIDSGAMLTHTRSRETVFDQIGFPHKDPKVWSEKELEAPDIPVMHPMPFSEWIKFERERARKPVVKKIISRPHEEEIVEFETNGFVGNETDENASDGEFLVQEYAGMEIIPFGCNVEYEQIEAEKTAPEQRQQDLYYEDIDFETEVYGGQKIVEEPHKLIIVVAADEKSDTLIEKLKASNKRAFSQADGANY